MREVDPEAAGRLFEKRNQDLIAFWQRRRFLCKTSRLLDVGAGTGHLVRSVRALLRGTSICCIEEGKGRAAQLAAQHFEVFRDADSIASKREFDAILLIEVIEHVRDPVVFLERLRPLLAPGGRIFLTTPCGELRTGNRRTNAYDTPEHVQFFTETSLRLAVQQAGFSEITYEYIDALYPRAESAMPVAHFKRLLMKIAMPMLMRFQGPRHLTGFIDP